MTLREALAQDDRSAAWLARQLGVSRATAARWANGTIAVPDEYVRPISRLLPISENDLRRDG